jgi:hypothetical protein
MFSIESDKALVTIRVNINRGVHSLYSFNHSLGADNNDGLAELLVEHIQKMFADRVARIRNDAYNTGWNDHKKRNTKKTLFNECFDSNDVGWHD